MSEQALERGLEDLWEDLVLAQYLDGGRDREETIGRVGRKNVQRAEREREVVEEDVNWGPNVAVAAVSDAGPLIPLAEIGLF
jgi:hypothetical protein